MGYTAEEYEAFYRKEFLWRSDKNMWHVQRAREMRKKYDIPSLEGYDPTTLISIILMTSSHLFLSIFIANMFKDSIMIIILFGWFLGGFWSCSAGLAIHEASHGLVLPGKWSMFLCGLIAECPHFLPSFMTFRHYHMPHHSYISINLDEKNNPQQSDKKLPKYDPDLPSDFEAYLFSKNIFTRILFLFMQVALYSFRPLVQFPRKLNMQDYIAIIKQLLFLYTAYYFGDYHAIIYIFSAAILGQGPHVASMHFIAEHYQVTDELSFTNDPKKAQDTFSYYGPLNFLMYNGGYHIEHHDFPQVPLKNLPKLKKMAPEYYDNLPHHTSYFKVLIRFIFKHPGLFQRIKRKYDD